MLLVSDANVFIDFEVAELTVQLFRLPHEIIVPDILYAARSLLMRTAGPRRYSLFNSPAHNSERAWKNQYSRSGWLGLRRHFFC